MMMESSALFTSLKDDIHHMIEHLRRLGQHADPDLYQGEVDVWVGE